MKRNLLIVLSVILLSSCASSRFTSRSMQIEQASIETTGLVVDVRPDFTHRVGAQSRRCKTEDVAKNEALFRCIVEHNVDVVVDPIYKVTRRANRYQAQVNGFPGYFENPRTELEYIQSLDSIKSENIEKFLLIKGKHE